MKYVADQSRKLIEENENLATEVARRMVLETLGESNLVWEVGRMSVYAVLPTQGMLEQADIEAYYASDGRTLDVIARDRRHHRIVLSKCITRLGDDVEFEVGDEGDDVAKSLVLQKLPELLVDRMWAGFVTQRNALLITLLNTIGEAAKKSPASLSGEPDGVSSEPREESPSAETRSPN